MSLNSLKKVVLAGMMFSAAVACSDKNKNNLKVDGTYEVEDSSATAGSNKTAIVQIKDNVMTTYKFSQDKKGVEVSSVKLDVRGKKIVGMSAMNDDACIDAAAGTPLNVTGGLKKTKSSLIMYTQTSDGSFTSVLKPISQERADEMLKDLKAGKIEKGCVENGKLIKSLGKMSAEEVAQAQEATQVNAESLAQVTENKSSVIPKGSAKETENVVLSKDDEDTVSTLSQDQQQDQDEASLKSNAQGSAEKQENELVSEQK